MKRKAEDPVRKPGFLTKAGSNVKAPPSMEIPSGLGTPKIFSDAGNLLLTTVLVIAAINLFSLVDASFRISSYRKNALLYAKWSSKPDLKKQFFEESYLRKVCKLEKLYKSGKISKQEFEKERQKELLLKKFRISEMPEKYAYYWYKKCLLFPRLCPPEVKKKIVSARKNYLEKLKIEEMKSKDYIID